MSQKATTAKPAKFAKKTQLGGAENKLISIRIPENMIDSLRKVAGEKGDLGYQQLIKSYISKGLGSEENFGNAASGILSKITKYRPEEIAGHKKPMKKIGMPKIKIKKQERDNVAKLTESRVIAEDIRELAAALKPYSKFFAGKTFLITGAFGFLGRYMVHLLKHMNEEVLETECRALLLDNFVTGYEQQVVSDKNLIFHRHDVIKPFETDEEIDYIIHAAGIASPVYYTKYPIETMDGGTIVTRNTLEVAYKKHVKSFIFMSSSEV